MVELALGFVSILIAAGALAWTFYTWRMKELRRDEVLAWGNSCIDVLQSIFFECRAIEAGREASLSNLLDLAKRASVLVEQGRIFFRNAKPDKFGQEKQLAYRGFRPRILDTLVSAFQVAEGVGSMSDERLISKCRKLSENNVRSFVSLLQMEVGRDKTACANTSVGGIGINLAYQLSEIDAESDSY